MQDQWLTIMEAVEYLRFPSRGALYQAIRRGQIPAHKLGARIRLKRSELDAAFTRTMTLTDLNGDEVDSC